MVNSVHITGVYYLRADSMNYILEKKVVQKKIDKETRKPTGILEEVTHALGYYRTIEDLINGCIELQIKEAIITEELQDFKVLMARTKEIINRTLEDVLMKGIK